MQIEVAQLRTLTEQMLKHLEDLNLGSIDLSDDYYWDTPSPQRYDPYIKPEELTM